jgi:hypothetical protein
MENKGALFYYQGLGGYRTYVHVRVLMGEVVMNPKTRDPQMIDDEYKIWMSQGVTPHGHSPQCHRLTACWRRDTKEKERYQLCSNSFISSTDSESASCSRLLQRHG